MERAVKQIILIIARAHAFVMVIPMIVLAELIIVAIHLAGFVILTTHRLFSYNSLYYSICRGGRSLRWIALRVQGRSPRILQIFLRYTQLK